MSVIIQGNTVIQGRTIMGYQLLLDAFPNAAAAYSLRKLSYTYTGSSIRVRRSSDNTEQDIGFDANANLDETALTTFVGAGNGFVTTWYDQSGNTRNATQSTAGNQPRIVNAGVVEKVNSKASIYHFINPSTYFDISNFDGYSNINGQTILSVIKPATTDANKIIVSKYNANANNRQWSLSVDNYNVQSNPSSYNANQQANFAVTTNYQLITAIWIPNISTIAYRNGINAGQASTTAATITTTTEIVRIGITGGTSTFYSGFLQEIIIYPTNNTLLKGQLENNINAYYNIY